MKSNFINCVFLKNEKKLHHFCLFKEKYAKFKNSKVFEQKGDLLNFTANIDHMAVLSQAKPS